MPKKIVTMKIEEESEQQAKGYCSFLNTWKNILVVAVAADRPLYPHVLRALNFE